MATPFEGVAHQHCRNGEETKEHTFLSSGSGQFEPFATRGQMSALCAKATAGVDAKHPLRIAALDASIGRKAGLQSPPREGPECAPKPPFFCEREIGFTARRGPLN